MDTNDDFYGKELNLNCFYMHTNFEQKDPKTAIVKGQLISKYGYFQNPKIGEFRVSGRINGQIKKKYYINMLNSP